MDARRGKILIYRSFSLELTIKERNEMKAKCFHISK